MTINFEIEDIKKNIEEFTSIYLNRPIKNNYGGMHFNHSFATWYILKRLGPKVVIESGVYEGHSTWLIEQACPEAEVFSLDINFGMLKYKSNRVNYIQNDFANLSWSGINKEEALCFFDDHQNAYSRLKDVYWAGFRKVIIEDNYPCGEGDCYSLKHMLKGFGHRQLQMSKKYLGSPQDQAIRQNMEQALWSIGPRQQLLVPPNDHDKKIFEENCAQYFEFPPVVLTEKSPIWDVNYVGEYATKPPIYDLLSLPSNLKIIMNSNPEEFDYCFLSYIELKN